MSPYALAAFAPVNYPPPRTKCEQLVGLCRVWENVFHDAAPMPYLARHLDLPEAFVDVLVDHLMRQGVVMRVSRGSGRVRDVLVMVRR